MDLHALPPRAVEELQQSHPGRPIHSSREGDGRGEWDADRLMQVVVNLLDNALKYSPEGTAVDISTRGEPDAVVLEVHNMGEPIPASLLPSIFEPFRRGIQSEQTVKMSLGLGLYIVQEIVRAHGGTADVRSTPQEGTIFRVRLPRRV
jgi:signal transduction histidine kinase